MSSSETTVEFAVNLTCNKCVVATESVLKNVSGVAKFDIDLDKQAVVVTSTLPTSELQKLIESTGKRAVVLGTAGPNKKCTRSRKIYSGILSRFVCARITKNRQ